MSEGTLEHMMELDYILDQFSKVKVKKMKPVIRNLLRSAVYQLKYMDSVPDAAVCNESVKLAVKKWLRKSPWICERGAAECGAESGQCILSGRFG